jgi:putative glutamine amidotransferase
MTARIAIPEPTSFDTTYNQRTFPYYLAALQSSGAIPIPIPLHESQASVARLLNRCSGILLTGSKADIDPQAYGETAVPQCAPSDPPRQAVDELLLQEAFNLHKPVLAICNGIQALSVWRGGSLIQHLETGFDHESGGDPSRSHSVVVSGGSRLESFLLKASDFEATKRTVSVNTSHHQAVKIPGDGMQIAARSIPDGVIEAIELNSTRHFVLGVQWHPERTYTSSAASRAIFSSFVVAAEGWSPRPIEESLAKE